MAPWSVGVRSFARQELTCLIRRRLLIVPRLGTGAKAPAMQHLLGAFLRHPRKARSTFFRVGRLPPLQNPSPKKAMPDLVLKRSRIVLNEVYDVVSEGRVVGRISPALGLRLLGCGSWHIDSTKGVLQRAARRLPLTPRCRRSRRLGTENEEDTTPRDQRRALEVIAAAAGGAPRLDRCRCRSQFIQGT
jgi:hypothetical protein